MIHVTQHLTRLIPFPWSQATVTIHYATAVDRDGLLAAGTGVQNQSLKTALEMVSKPQGLVSALPRRRVSRLGSDIRV